MKGMISLEGLLALINGFSLSASNKRWLGEKLIEEGVKNLKLLEGKIDTQKMNKPSFLMVLTGVGDYAYRRKDGVYVVPIGSLKD